MRRESTSPSSGARRDRRRIRKDFETMPSKISMDSRLRIIPEYVGKIRKNPFNRFRKSLYVEKIETKQNETHKQKLKKKKETKKEKAHKKSNKAK